MTPLGHDEASQSTSEYEGTDNVSVTYSNLERDRLLRDLFTPTEDVMVFSHASESSTLSGGGGQFTPEEESGLSLKRLLIPAHFRMVKVLVERLYVTFPLRSVEIVCNQTHTRMWKRLLASFSSKALTRDDIILYTQIPAVMAGAIRKPICPSDILRQGNTRAKNGINPQMSVSKPY
jgi:hypothetical protein